MSCDPLVLSKVIIKVHKSSKIIRKTQMLLQETYKHSITKEVVQVYNDTTHSLNPTFVLMPSRRSSQRKECQKSRVQEVIYAIYHGHPAIVKPQLLSLFMTLYGCVVPNVFTYLLVCVLVVYSCCFLTVKVSDRLSILSYLILFLSYLISSSAVCMTFHLCF